MAIFKLHKGLDIRLNGVATTEKGVANASDTYGLVPDDFIGIMPKVVVREGDIVKAGDFLFVDKRFPEVGFASPVSGEVTSVLRGERRKLLCVKVKADSKQTSSDSTIFLWKSENPLNTSSQKESLMALNLISEVLSAIISARILDRSSVSL